MTIIPDCTLVTACFCMNKYNSNARDINETIKSTKTLIDIPCYIVFFGDSITIPLLKEMREKQGLTNLSIFYELEPEKIWSFQFIEIVKKNRESYWPTKDERTCTETHLITCNKFDFVLKVIESNPFNTSKFGWIDSFLNNNCSKICEDYNPYKLLYVLNNVTDKFHLQILNVVDKKFKEPQNKHKYYNQYIWLVCGCLFTCGKEIGIKILNRLKEIFVSTTLMGYGHGEEMLYLEVLDEFYDDIVKSYGDYGQILNNFIKPTKNINYIHNIILNKYVYYGYYREAYDCSQTLLNQIESYELFVEWDEYLSILCQHFVASFYYKPLSAIETFDKVNKLRETNSYIRDAYNKNYDYYDQQFKYVNNLRSKKEF
jgi:hypothetical protein